MKLQQGLTLIEILVVIAIVAILVGIGVPAMNNLITNNKLVGATESLYGDMQLARSEAIKLNQPVYVVFQPGTDWCYGLSTNIACNCTTSTDCSISGRTFITNSTAYSGLTLTDAAVTFANNRTTFSPRRGTATAGTATFATADNSTSVVVSAIGRVRACGTVGGFPAC